MRETKIEKKLREEVESLGGWALKFIPNLKRGMPDRLVLLPQGRTILVEVKAPGEKLEPLQRKRKKQLTRMGHDVRTLDSIAGVRELIREIGDGV